jgi:hypothetical protein
MDPPECQTNLRAYSASPENASYRHTSSTRNRKSPSAAASNQVYQKYRHTSSTRNRKSPSAAASNQHEKYTLGDPARPADVDIFHSASEHVAAVEKLKEGDYCFILRSDYRFTYALVLKQKNGMLSLQVNEKGCTKSIPTDHWKKYIRTLFTGFSKTQLPREDHHRDERWHDREHQSEQKVSTRHRRVTTSHQRNFSLATNDSKSSSSSANSHHFKRSVSNQEAAPLKKCCKQGHHERSQTESGHNKDYVSQSGSDDSSVSSLDSFTDSDGDSSLEEDFNNLLTKSMPSPRHVKEGQNLLHGAFGDVTKIEVLD